MRRLRGLKRAYLAALTIVALLGALPSTAEADNAATLRFSPQPLTAEVGQEFTVSVQVDDVAGLAGAQIYIDFDPAVLEVQGVALGSLWGSAESAYKSIDWDNVDGQIDVTVALMGVPAVSGSGSVLDITFKAKAGGESDLEFVERVLHVEPMPTLLSDGDGNEISTSQQNGKVTLYELDYLSVLPAVTEVVAGETVTYRAEVYDTDDVQRGLVTGQTTFTISPGANGSMLGSTYVSETAGSWSVQGSYTSPGGETLLDQASLTVKPAVAETMVLYSSSQVLSPGLTAFVTATVTDVHGNLVADGTVVTFSTNRGAFVNSSDTFQVTTVSGVAEAVYTAGDPSGSIGTVTASSGNAVDSLQFAIRDSAELDEATYLPAVFGPVSAP